MNFEPTEEQNLIREMVRSLAETKIQNRRAWTRSSSSVNVTLKENMPYKIIWTENVVEVQFSGKFDFEVNKNANC